MKLYLLRHGIAEEGQAGMPDEARQLTPEGRKRLKDVLRVARAAGITPTAVFSSPLVRAVETAEIAAQELKYEGKIAETKTLVPGADPRTTWEDIRAHKQEAELLLSSHNPLCSLLAAYLLNAPELYVDYKKGAMMRIDFDTFGAQPHGILRWFLTPGLTS